MRFATAARCREAVDSLSGLDDPRAWQIREACLHVWPSTVVKSLGPLVGTPRGWELLLLALGAHADSISLLKHAALVALSGRRIQSVLAA
jgi:dTMP kinase